MVVVFRNTDNVSFETGHLSTWTLWKSAIKSTLLCIIKCGIWASVLLGCKMLFVWNKRFCAFLDKQQIAIHPPSRSTCKALMLFSIVFFVICTLPITQVSNHLPLTTVLKDLVVFSKTLIGRVLVSISKLEYLILGDFRDGALLTPWLQGPISYSESLILP